MRKSKLNWNEVKSQPTAETYDETAYRTLDEARSIKGYKKWSLGNGYRKSFDKYLEYVTPVNKHTDTNKFIEKLNLKGSMKKFKEGYGAGYNVEFYGIKLQNVKIVKNYKDKYGVQCADFTAEIIPDAYDWSADHPMWSLDSRESNYYDDFEFEVEPVKVSGIVKGNWVNGDQSWTDENADDFNEEEVAEEITQESFDIGYSYSWGWIHTDLKNEWHIPNDNDPNGYIDTSDERSGYKNCFIDSADLILDADAMNNAIDMAENPEDYFGSEEEEEDDYYSFDKANELSRLHRNESKKHTSRKLKEFKYNFDDKATRKEIFNYMKILSFPGYTDYNQMIEYLMEDFGMSRDEAAGWIDRYNMNKKPYRESIKGNTKKFTQNLVNILNEYMPSDEDWLDMEEWFIHNSRGYNYGFADGYISPLLIKKYVEGGAFACYTWTVFNELAELYENTPEEKARWEKLSDDKLWDRYVNVMATHLPKAFKLRMGREMGKDVPIREQESRVNKKNRITEGRMKDVYAYIKDNSGKCKDIADSLAKEFNIEKKAAEELVKQYRESKIREKNSGTVEVLLYYKNSEDREKALKCLSKNMTAYRFDDYYSYDFRGAVTKGALETGVVVYGNYKGKIDDEAKDIFDYANEICHIRAIKYEYTRSLEESKMKEKFWKDPYSEQARAEQHWWKHDVKTMRDNIWEDPDHFSYADVDARKSLKRFGKIYVDTKTYKPIEPNYVKSLIDEWGDK